MVFGVKFLTPGVVNIGVVKPVVANSGAVKSNSSLDSLSARSIITRGCSSTGLTSLVILIGFGPIGIEGDRDEEDRDEEGVILGVGLDVSSNLIKN